MGRTRTKPSGLSLSELFEHGLGITYNDFTILNTTKSTINKSSISLQTDLGKGIILPTPIIASPMDTVTNAPLCIAVAQEGGIGAIHYNHKNPDGSSNVAQQEEEIGAVKRFQNGFIQNPITVAPYMTIAQAIERGRLLDASGSIENFPVTENGESNGKLVGLLRKQDYFPGSRTDAIVSERMLRREKVVTASWPLTLDEATEILWQRRIPSVPIIDESGNLKYLVTRSDVEKRDKYPLATLDANNRLRVLFAVSTWPESYERLERGFGAGADGVIIDTSQGYSKYEQQMIRYIRDKYPDKLLIGGNVSTREGALFLANEKVDAYRNGQGSGSICTTAGAIGISRSGATGVYEGADALRRRRTKTIADGGLKEVGDLVKALTIGAHCCMLGKMLASTDESPGETVIDAETGRRVKIYRGMGSAEANAGGKRGYSRLPEGVSGKVNYRGSVHEWVPLIRDGLLHAFEVLNCTSIAELHKQARSGYIRFERRTVASLQESGINVVV